MQNKKRKQGPYLCSHEAIDDLAILNTVNSGNGHDLNMTIATRRAFQVKLELLQEATEEEEGGRRKEEGGRRSRSSTLTVRATEPKDCLFTLNSAARSWC